jgi:hypothetical protein
MLRYLFSYFYPTRNIQKDQIKMISQPHTYQPDCLYKIELDELDYEKLKGLIPQLPYEPQLQSSITKVIEYYQQNPSEYLIDQMDWLVFYRNRVPLLQIKIANAFNHRKKVLCDNFKEDRVYELVANL